MNHGELIFRDENSPDAEPFVEQLGTVLVDRGASTIRLQGTGQSLVSIETLERNPGGLVQMHSQNIHLQDESWLVDGLLPAWIGAGYLYLTLDSENRLEAVEFEHNTLSTADANTGVLVSNVQRLFTDKEIYALQAREVSGGPLIELFGNRLTIRNGGIRALTSRGRELEIADGELTIGDVANGELMFAVGSTRVSANIVDPDSGPLSVLVNGEVSLSGANTYTGPTRVYGNLEFESVDALPAGSLLQIDGGDVRFDIPASASVQLGTIELLNSGSLSRTERAPVSFELIDLQSGIVGANLIGDGLIRKTTSGKGVIAVSNPEFTGDVEVNAGLLVLSDPQALGQGHLALRGTGALEGTVGPSAHLRLEDGQLRGRSEFAAPIELIGSIDILPYVLNEQPNNFNNAIPRANTLKISGPISGGGELHILGSSVNFDPEFGGQFFDTFASTILAANNQQLTGSIVVHSGVLTLEHEQALGDGSVRVLPGGVLNLTQWDSVVESQLSSFTGNVELAGGMLASAFSPSRTTKRLAKSLRVTSNSIVAPYGDMAIDGGLELHDHVGLSFLGNGTVSVFGELSLGEGSFLAAGVSNHVVLDTTLVAASNISQLYLDNPGVISRIELEKLSLKVPAGHSLEVLQDGVYPALQISGDLRTVHGGGTIVNSVNVSQGATVSPGDNAGRLTVLGDVTLGPASRFQWDVKLGHSIDEVHRNDRMLVGEAFHLTATPANPLVVIAVPQQTTFPDRILKAQHAFQLPVIVANAGPQWDPAGVELVSDSFLQAMGAPPEASLHPVRVGHSLHVRYVPVPWTDFNADGQVDHIDRDTLLDNWTGSEQLNDATPRTFDQGDSDGDGDVDALDLTHLMIGRTGFGETGIGPADTFLEYSPSSGDVRLVTGEDGRIVSFVLTTSSGQFLLDELTLPFGPDALGTEATLNLIGSTDAAPISPGGPTLELGRIFPTGLASLEPFIDLALFARADGTGGILQLKILEDPIRPGDFDDDGDVDSVDLQFFIGEWTGPETPDPPKTLAQGDFDGDGNVDSNDLGEFLALWTGSLDASILPAGSYQAIPEPNSLFMGLCCLGLGVARLAGRSRRARSRGRDTQ